MEKGALLPEEQQGFGDSAVLCDFSAVGSVSAGGGAVTTGQGAQQGREGGRQAGSWCWAELRCCFAAIKVSHSSGTWEVNPGCLQTQNVPLFTQNKHRHEIRENKDCTV